MRVSHDEIIGHPERRPFLLEPPGVVIKTVKMSDAVDMAALASLEDAQVEGEPDIVVELIDLYLEDASNKLVAIREAIAKTDETSLMRTAHGLRGSSASLGAHRMAALCGELEQTGFSDSTQKVESLRIRLKREFELVRQVFAVERLRRL